MLLKGMKACLEPGGGKESEEGAQAARQPSLASSRVRVRFTRKSFQVAKKPLYKAVLEGRPIRLGSSPAMAGEGTMALLILAMGITGSIVPGTHSPEAVFISRAWKAFGGWQRGRLSKVKGVPDHTVHLPLEETEWRDNNRHSNRYKLRLTDLRVWFKTISGFSCPCEMSGDASDVCDGDPGRRACDGFFPVF